MVYVLFLEPREGDDPSWSTFEKMVNSAVKLCQPSPALAHCELLVPPVPSDETLRAQFATYLGRSSGWQTDRADGCNYYLAENAGRWRALPVFCENAAELVRNEADAELGVAYSLGRYLTAVPPGRCLAKLVPGRRHTRTATRHAAATYSCVRVRFSPPAPSS